jgi:hypothetical protein
MPRYHNNSCENRTTFRSQLLSKSNNDSNSSASKSGDSNKHEQPEGVISGLPKIKRKLAEIDKEQELYKIEPTKKWKTKSSK